jgi:hypothetical protein
VGEVEGVAMERRKCCGQRGRRAEFASETQTNELIIKVVRLEKVTINF